MRSAGEITGGNEDVEDFEDFGDVGDVEDVEDLKDLKDLKDVDELADILASYGTCPHRTPTIGFLFFTDGLSRRRTGGLLRRRTLHHTHTLPPGA